MLRTYDIAPRVTLFPLDGPAPPARDGWIALPQVPQSRGSPFVFGDGSHPTTRLCATAVDLLCRLRHPKAVLDVGTGTGILARIARARGASFIVGTDIDPDALAFAKSNVALDAFPVDIELTCQPPDHWGTRFDLIVGNILEGPLQSLAPCLQRALAPGGTLLISGFTRPQAPKLRVLCESLALTCVGQSALDDWVLVTFEAGSRP
jgi:ribosomal protein L11 methyltransferase